MNTNAYIGVMLVIILILMREKQNKECVAAVRLRNKKVEGDKMEAMAKQFVGKTCLITIFGGSTVKGVLREVREHALLLDKKGKTQIVNLEFVTCIEEIPQKNKD